MFITKKEDDMEYKVINAAGGLVRNHRGEFLMIFRRGCWDLPKGKLEPDEEIEQCAVREVSEETGLEENRIQLGNLICTTIHHYELSGQQIEKHTYWYNMLYTPSEGEDLKPQTEEDIETAVWVTTKEAEKNLQNTYDTIREVFTKR